jgi:tRNA threonylcarbamoyladenosine biosynthesis protein TsaE
VNIFRIASEEGTRVVAAAIAPMVRGGGSFGLSGELGAGKTTLVRHIVSVCGGDPTTVASPTYTLQHEYKLPSGIVIEHWDLYRLTSLPYELEERVTPKVARFIEWPERCPEIIPSLTYHLKISHALMDGRSAERIVEVLGPGAAELSDSLRGGLERL